jgi:TonB family protein
LEKDKIYSFLGTVIFHLIILLILGFTVLRTVLPDEDSGILVNFGNVDAASGTFEPMYTGEVPPQEISTPEPEYIPPVSSPQPEPEDLITQNEEETVAINDAKRKAEERRKEEARLTEERRKREEARKETERLAEEKRRQEAAAEQQRRQNVINDRVAGAFGSGNAAGNNQGDAATGSGNQGNPFGNSDHGANTGVGGYGSFNLNGRSIGSGGLPRPTYNVQEEGRIVINITVDPKGNVISADIGRGTNIDNGSLRQSALDAARRAKFNSIQGANNQSGTITYNYTLK